MYNLILFNTRLWMLSPVLFVLGLAGIGLFGSMDVVRRVEAGAQQFLLALAVASPHGFERVKVNRQFFLLFFYLLDCLSLEWPQQILGVR